MVSCCVDPACCAEFRLSSIGDLYALERRSADTEFFWLCPACVPVVALALDSMGCVSVRPQSHAVRPQPPHPDGYLRLISQRKLPTPWHRAGSPPRGRRSQADMDAIRFLRQARLHKPCQYQDPRRRVRNIEQRPCKHPRSIRYLPSIRFFSPLISQLHLKQRSRLLFVCALRFKQVSLSSMFLSTPTLSLQKQEVSCLNWTASMKALEARLTALSRRPDGQV